MSNWDSLSPDQQQIFINIANKETSNMSAESWFEHLVPEAIQSNGEKTEVFMNGGEVTTEEWVYDRGMANGHWEETTHTLPDRDVSRIESGHNGGEYTADNTIMEDRSPNRSRGAEDMTDGEYTNITGTNELDATLLENGELVLVSDTGATTVALDPFEYAEPATEALTLTSVIGDAADVLFEGLLPAVAAYNVGTYIGKRQPTLKSKFGWGALASGGTALIACTPPGQLACGVWATYKLGKFALKQASKLSSKPATVN